MIRLRRMTCTLLITLAIPFSVIALILFFAANYLSGD